MTKSSDKHDVSRTSRYVERGQNLTEGRMFIDNFETLYYYYDSYFEHVPAQIRNNDKNDESKRP